MSMIPTKQIDGDVAVGRNVSTGGNATVKGNMHVNHNVIIDGWLTAKNVTTQCKGVFRSISELRSAVTDPKPGDWAMIIATDAGNEVFLQVLLWDDAANDWEYMGDISKSTHTFEVDIYPYVTHLESAILAMSRQHEDDVASLRDKIDTVIGEGASDAIDNFAEVLRFLDGLNDDETLQGKLIEINTAITALTADTQRLKSQVDAIAIYPFDGLIYDATEALAHPTGSIWYSVKERMFFSVDTSGTTISKHNAYHINDLEIRGDILFRCGNALYTKGSDKQLKKFVDEEALAAIIKETTANRPEVVPLSESQYEALATAGELSDDVIYMTYEDDSE